jgi:hypothetical protein
MGKSKQCLYKELPHTWGRERSCRPCIKGKADYFIGNSQCSLSTVLVGDTTSLPSPSHQLHQHHHHYFFSDSCGTTTREGDIPCHRPHVPARLSWATSRIALSASRRSTPVRAGRTSTGNQGSIGHRRFSQFDVVPF